MKTHKIKPRLTDKEAAELGGSLLTEKDFNVLITYDADVFCAESGQCIAKFRKKAIPASIAQTAHKNLRTAAKVSANRGTASGVLETEKHATKYWVRKDGVVSNTMIAPMVQSGIIGYFDRNPRMPFCRQTAWTMKQFEKFKKAYPIIKFVDTKYAELMPDHYAKQREMADRTSEDFVIRNTAFTTVTVNRNWQTAVHKDAGDFAEGFGNLVVLREGRYTGGYFVLPKWGVAFDLQNCDVLLTDVHQWHGNTPIHKIDEDAERISLVMYYRENMINCGTATEEMEVAKKRQRGESLS